MLLTATSDANATGETLLLRSATPAPGDRIRIMQQSLRCFTLGLIGSVPVLGIVAATQATKLFWRVARETGEPLQGKKIYRFWILAMCLSLLHLGINDVGESLVIVLLCAGVQLEMVIKTCKIPTNQLWNPARTYLLWGLASAHVGIFCTVWAALVFVKENSELLTWPPDFTWLYVLFV
jgi:hypothetical protein